MKFIVLKCDGDQFAKISYTPNSDTPGFVRIDIGVYIEHLDAIVPYMAGKWIFSHPNMPEYDYEDSIKCIRSVILKFRKMADELERFSNDELAEIVNECVKMK